MTGEGANMYDDIVAILAQLKRDYPELMADLNEEQICVMAARLQNELRHYRKTIPFGR